MSSLQLSNTPDTANEHYVTLPTCLLKTLTGITDLSSTNSLTTLEKLFFIKVVSTYQVNQCKPIAMSAKQWSKSIGIHTSQTPMSGCELLRLQQSLEKKGFLQVKRSKNMKNMDLRNILTPIIPSDLFDVLLHSPSNRSQNDSERRGEESDLQWIVRTKLFVPIRYDVLKTLLSCSVTSASHKLFVLRNYLTAFKNFQVTGKLAFSVTTKELIAKLGMSRATIFRILKTIRDSVGSNLTITHQYLNSDDIDDNRRDKSVFKLSFSLEFLPHWAREVLPTVSSLETGGLEIPPLYKKDIIIKKDIDKKDKDLENETSSFSSKFKNKKKGVSFLQAKPFIFYHPLSSSEVSHLNWKSNREFATNYGNQLLLKLALQYPDKHFATKNHFMSYMTQAFINELRQGPMVNHDSFRLACNVSKDEQACENKIAEKYLAEIEDSRDVSKIMQLRRKIIGAFNTTRAYEIILNTQILEEEGSVEVKLNKNLNLSNKEEASFQNCILAVYGSDKDVNIQYSKAALKQEAKRQRVEYQDVRVRTVQTNVLSADVMKEDANLHALQRSLREELGLEVDRRWFADMEIIEDVASSVLSIVSDSKFASDWKRCRYGHVIARASKDLGFKFVEYSF